MLTTSFQLGGEVTQAGPTAVPFTGERRALGDMTNTTRTHTDSQKCA